MQLAISSKDIEEEHVLYSRSENIKLTLYNDANEVVDELFETFRSRYQGYSETFRFDHYHFSFWISMTSSFKKLRSKNRIIN